MTKQEEIRAEVEKYISKAYWYEGEKNTVVNITEELLSYLHSQGVVIKVDRDLVNTTRETEEVKGELFCAIDAYVGNRATFHDLMKGIAKAGYVAVEPLIQG